MTVTTIRARGPLPIVLPLVTVLVTVLLAGCGSAATIVPAFSAPVCARPDQPPGTETQVPVDGFVRFVALVGSDVWVALRGGRLAKLDAFCDSTLLTLDVGGTVFPDQPAGATVDFSSLASDGDGTLWAVMALSDAAGTPIRSAVVRFDARTELVTASQSLGVLGRSAAGLAVNGDFVWVADARTAGTAARLDPRTGAVVATVRTPVDVPSADAAIAVDNQGLLWASGGAQGVDVLDPTGGTVATVDVPGTPVEPDIAPADDVVWIAGGGGLQEVSDTGRSLLATGAVALTMLASVGSTVWGVRSGVDEVVHVAADGATVLARYPVQGGTLSLAAQQHDLWRVDFAGVLHHIAV